VRDHRASRRLIDIVNLGLGCKVRRGLLQMSQASTC